MKKKKRVGIAFLTIFAILICVALGYEMLEESVNLTSANSVTKDKWCVKIEDVSNPSLEGEAKTDSVSKKGTILNFTANFKSVDDSVSYDAYVTNCGTVDAYLYDETLSGLEDDFTYTINGIKAGDVIKPDDSVKVSVNVKNGVDKETNLDLKMELKFSQNE